MTKHFFLTFGVFLLALGCGDDSGPGGRPPECAEIVDKCHEVDPGSGPIHECHENAESVWTAEQCIAEEANCLAICVVTTDGGEDAPLDTTDDTTNDTTGDTTTDTAGDAAGDGALGCANAGTPCTAPLMCCSGMPYPPEGVCMTSCMAVSDRALKEGIRSIDTDRVLEQLATVPIQQWTYRSEPGVQHMGPMAQDFHATFELGADNRHIHPVDASGVTMAAIQALYRRVQALEAQNQSLAEENRRLRARRTAR